MRSRASYSKLFDTAWKNCFSRHSQPCSFTDLLNMFFLLRFCYRDALLRRRHFVRVAVDGSLIFVSLGQDHADLLVQGHHDES